MHVDPFHLQGYKMDDLLTSYISQMLSTMNKHSGRGHNKWSSYWQEANELIRILRPIGQHCSWRRTYANQLWRMSRTYSASSEESVFTRECSIASSSDPGEGPSKYNHSNYDLNEDELSYEDDYLWHPIWQVGRPDFGIPTAFIVKMFTLLGL